MKRGYALLLFLMLPFCVQAQIPAIKNLGKEMGKMKDVKHVSVGRFMLGMASTFAGKEQRTVFKMLDNIEIIECGNVGYAPSLSGKVQRIMDDAGASLLATHDDGKALNKVYAVNDSAIVSELIIAIYFHNGTFSLVAMSGEIPLERLDEISKIKP